MRGSASVADGDCLPPDRNIWRTRQIYLSFLPPLNCIARTLRVFFFMVRDVGCGSAPTFHRSARWDSMTYSRVLLQGDSPLFLERLTEIPVFFPAPKSPQVFPELVIWRFRSPHLIFRSLAFARYLFPVFKPQGPSERAPNDLVVALWIAFG